MINDVLPPPEDFFAELAEEEATEVLAADELLDSSAVLELAASLEAAAEDEDAHPTQSILNQLRLISPAVTFKPKACDPESKLIVWLTVAHSPPVDVISTTP